MKYGDTLRQRSIPEWGHFNIDYDYLKDLIKHQTTPGTSKALSIPGQGETSERAFGDTFFKVLKAQHDRINMFIRSKSGEIERRLEHISRSLAQLEAQGGSGAPGSRLPARTVERYAKIDADVNKAGEEIRSLSRFRGAQRTGFHKILKKYKRWTKESELGLRFKEEIIENPESFFQLDLGYLLDQYIDVLGAVRAPFDAFGAHRPATESTNALSASSRISKNLDEGSELDFDIALTTIPLGSRGAKATYWVHLDHIVEVEVLLLQYMRLYTSAIAKTNKPSQDSPYATPGRRKSSATTDKYLGNEEEVGLVVLDQPESFAIRQNTSTIGSSEEAPGALCTKAVGHARWISSGEAAVVVGLETNRHLEGTESIHVAKAKRKNLEAFLNPSSKSIRQRDAGSSNLPADDPTEDFTQDKVAVREWLADHPSVKPVAGVCTKRTRFVGLHNSAEGGSWATLDRDCFMKASLHSDLKSGDWISDARKQSTRFPHAVLEVRREGHQSSALIQTLDRSHLVERVRGFSLEAHTVWTCCKPNAMAAPFWIALLDKDIRKLPAPVKRQRRKAPSNADSVSQSPPYTSTSANSDGQTTPYTSRNGESSVTSVADFTDPPPLRIFRKKSRRQIETLPAIQSEPPSEQQRYWNEYDNPEDEDEGYYIYIDPNASVKFPGQETLEACIHKARKFFGVRSASEESSLLSTPEEVSSDDETADEAPESTRRNYGTLNTSIRPSSSEGYFSGIFQSLRNPHRDVEALQSIRRRSARERRTLLSELEIRQHKTEMTKLRFYSTCLVTAVVIDIILGIMTTTSRKKVRGTVDSVILFGTICTLTLSLVAVLSMRTRHERLGWVHQAVVLFIVSGVVVVDVLLLRWMLRL